MTAKVRDVEAYIQELLAEIERLRAEADNLTEMAGIAGDASYANGRNDALEEAAKVAEGYLGRFLHGEADAGEIFALDIRALKEKQP